MSAGRVLERLLMGFAVAQLLLAVLSGVSFVKLRDVLALDSETHRAEQALASLERLVTRVTDAETAGRGYALTSEDRYLRPLERVEEDVASELESLADLLSGRSAQLEELAVLARQRVRLVFQLVELRKLKGLQSAMDFMHRGQGLLTMESFRRICHEVARDERIVFGARRGRMEQELSTALHAILMGNLTSCLFMAAALALSRGLPRDAGGDSIAVDRTAQARPVSQGWLLGLGGTAVIMVGALDHAVGWHYSLSILYLIPILLASIHGGLRASVPLALFAGTTWLIADLHSGAPTGNSTVGLWNALLGTSVFVLVAWFVTRLRDVMRHAQQLAMRDGLTGILNGRQFRFVAERELARAKRTGAPFTLVYIDLDNFKTVNDTYGHLRGDQLLQFFTDRVGRRIRVTDAFGRLGGDEFAMLLTDATPDSVRTKLESIQRSVTAELEEQRMPVTLSVGAVTFMSPPASISDALQKADRLMYQVKGSSKNRLEHVVVR